jgi:hypothetical protein
LPELIFLFVQFRSYTIAKNLKLKWAKLGKNIYSGPNISVLQYFEKEMMFYNNILVQSIKIYKIYYKLYFYPDI